MKKFRILLFLAVFLSVIVVIYWNVDSASQQPAYQHQLSLIDDRINVLEKDIKETQILLETIKSYVRRLANSYERRVLPDQKTSNVTFSDYQSLHIAFSNSTMVAIKLEEMPIGHKICSGEDAVADVKVFDMVASLPFDNVDGGVWKQGFDITPNLERWTQQKPLQIFVIPHSHTDPGWVKTFTKYYEVQTKNILDTMLVKLDEDKNRKFIYAEMVFFALWWSELNDGDRQKVRKLVSSGQLELVGGGWVMPDEAVSHYYGVLDQLQEGHSWLKRNLDLEVVSSWAIDPFGHSPTIAYLQKMAGLHGGVIQRVHYSLKKKLARDKNLEFFWRQQWDDTGETDFLTHMMPFYSYDVPHTCGPNPSVCCQFDFNRMPAVSKVRCPWNAPPVEITDGNVAERAAMLVDQYRKKAELFRTDSLLIPVGDDFRWETPVEWDAQMSNYGRLFKEINSRKEWNVNIRWATLSEYLNSVTKADRTDAPLESLAGDFFTYADRDDHYWSGYYTSRPFQKRFSRIVEAQQRAADILFSLALAECHKFDQKAAEKKNKCHFPAGQIMHQLTGARRNLNLFQHHDGITGTAKDFVVEDYGVKLLSAFQDNRYVQQVSASFLLLNDKSLFLNGDQFNVLTALDSYATHDSLPEMFVLRPDDSAPRWISMFNSLAWKRNTVVRLLVSTPNVSVINEHSGKPVRSEAFLHWTSTEQASPDTYLLVFEVDIAPLAIELYRIEAVKTVGPMHTFGQVTIYNSATSDDQRLGPFKVKRVAVNDNKLKSVSLSTSSQQAEFSLEKGTLLSVSGRHWSLDVAVEFLSYGAKDGKEKSGAYLFIPDDDDPHPISQNTPPLIRLQKGRLISEVTSFILMVEHRYVLMNLTSHSERAKKKLASDVLAEVDISNIVDIRGVQSNFEMAMRVQSTLKTKDTFYTDLNGFQMSKRVRYEKLTPQGNFYPIASAIVIEDGSSSKNAENGLRLALLTAQAVGATSPKSGAVEVIVDRRLMQDDNRGLGQPLKDNKRTEAFYRLVLERRGQPVPTNTPSSGIGFLRLSIPMHHYSMDLMYGALVMPARSSMTGEQAARLGSYKPLGGAAFPCDLHLVSLRPLQAEEDIRATSSPSKSTPNVDPTDRPLLSLHRLLADEQCSEGATVVSSTPDAPLDTSVSTCSAEQNSTKLATLFADSKFPHSTFEPILLSGRRSNLLLSPSEHSLMDVISPGHIRSFLITLA